VLHAGSIPYRGVPPGWDLRIWGLVDTPVTWTWDELMAQDVTTVTCDIHCVTSWTKLGTRWEGVAVRPLLERLGLQDGASHVIAHAEEGYTANMPLERVMRDDVLLAHRYDGAALEPQHGGPLRLLVPSLYFWKSAKWLRGFEFMAQDKPGFWENYGYHMRGDPWQEERYDGD
jgi:DMSO/TMAO reductase YedYZ molybdopterin-dependent catalytic subunit